jgi:hypothetical protein
MQSSHRLRPAMALVRVLLAPTASGDGAGERFCLTAAFASLFRSMSRKEFEKKIESGGKFED